jgi:glycosyltransferase involved in cell wall biosynthesis
MVRKSASIILPCKNEGDNVRNTLDSLQSTVTSVKYEIIVVDDGSRDGSVESIQNYPKYNRVRFFKTDSIGSAKARNFGAEQANGDFLVFCDAHVFVEAFWLDKLLSSFTSSKVGAVSPGIAPHDNVGAVGYGQSMTERLEAKWHIVKPQDNTEVTLVPGGCVVFPKEVFQEIGGFNKGFRVWGLEDLEISYRTWIMGYTCLVNPQVKVLHVFRPKHPYRVTMDDVNYNMIYMAFAHFRQERITKVLEMVKNYSTFNKVLTEVVFSDVWEQRQYYEGIRKYDDDWFFEKFDIKL